MSWFKRSQEGITTSTEEKLEVPDGLWFKCPSCKKTSTTAELKENLYVCIHCSYHARINSIEYFALIYDDGKHELVHAENILRNPIGVIGVRGRRHPPKKCELQAPKKGTLQVSPENEAIPRRPP